MIGGPLFFITFVSILVSVVAAVVFRYIGNQEAIKNVNNTVKAHIIELRIFNYSPVLVLKSLLDIIRNFFKYLFYVLKPIVVIIIPVVIVLIQLHYVYDYLPLKPGDSTLLTVKFKNNINIEDKDIKLHTTENLKIDSSPVYIKEKNEISWKILIKDYGKSLISLELGNENYEKDIIVSQTQKKVEPISIGGSFLARIKHIGVPFFANDGILESISVEYPKGGSVSLFGVEVHWVIVFLVVSLLVGIAIMKVLGIQW